METLFLRSTFLKRTKGVKRRNMAASRVLHSFTILANLYPDKILLFLRCHERQKCTENLGPK